MAIDASKVEGAGRRLRLGMVGGGQGAFIGAVHRIAARLDDRYTLVAGAFSEDPARASASAAELGVRSRARLRHLRGDGAGRGGARRRHRRRHHRHAEPPASRTGQGVPRGRYPRHLRQAADDDPRRRPRPGRHGAPHWPGLRSHPQLHGLSHGAPGAGHGGGGRVRAPCAWCRSNTPRTG